jgi:hypothetical protein
MENRIKELCTFREARTEDHAFILSTWLRGLYYGGPFFREIEKSSFFKHYQLIVKGILARSQIQIACLKEDHDVILGYAVTQEKNTDVILHWVFVKSAWRRVGLARDLIPNTVSAVTHLTQVGKSLKPEKWKFDPFLI